MRNGWTCSKLGTSGGEREGKGRGRIVDVRSVRISITMTGDSWRHDRHCYRGGLLCPRSCGPYARARVRLMQFIGSCSCPGLRGSPPFSRSLGLRALNCFPRPVHLAMPIRVGTICIDSIHIGQFPLWSLLRLCSPLLRLGSRPFCLWLLCLRRSGLRRSGLHRLRKDLSEHTRKEPLEALPRLIP